jgi:hypothetical protein
MKPIDIAGLIVGAISIMIAVAISIYLGKRAAREGRMLTAEILKIEGDFIKKITKAQGIAMPELPSPENDGDGPPQIVVGRWRDHA